MCCAQKYSFLPHGEGHPTGHSRGEWVVKTKSCREKSYITGISIDEGGKGWRFENKKPSMMGSWEDGFIPE